MAVDESKENTDMKSAVKEMQLMKKTSSNLKTSLQDRYNLSDEPLMLPRIDMASSAQSS